MRSSSCSISLDRIRMSGPDWKRCSKRRAGPAFLGLARTRMLLSKTALIGRSLTREHRRVLSLPAFLVARPHASHRLDDDFINLFFGNILGPAVHSFEVLFQTGCRFPAGFLRGSLMRPESHDAHLLVVLEPPTKLRFQHL